MLRKAKEKKYKSVSSVTFPILPKTCINCKGVFHIECGRKFITVNMFGAKERYLCKMCSSNDVINSDKIFQSYESNRLTNLKQVQSYISSKWPPPLSSFGTMLHGVPTKQNNDYITIIKKEKQ